MTKSDNLNELATALAKAQSEMTGAPKDAKNPFFKSTYATLESVWDTCRGPLTKNGLSVCQTVETVGDKSSVATMLLHSSGQFISSELQLILSKNDMQAMGSAISYARRYALMAVVGIAQADDDANAATGKVVLEEKKTPQATYRPSASPTTTTQRTGSPSRPQSTVSAKSIPNEADKLKKPDDLNGTLDRLKNQFPGVPGPKMPTAYKDEEPWPDK